MADKVAQTHDVFGNELCDKCGGSGTGHNIDLMAAKSEKGPCKACRGSGIKDGKRMFGPRLAKLDASIVLMQYLHEGKPVSTVELWCRYVRNDQGKNLTIVGTDGKPAMPVSYGEIRHMYTSRNYRRKGYVRMLIAGVLAQPSLPAADGVGIHLLGWVETSWHDSSEAGRALLQTLDFKREGDKLIWRMKGIKDDHVSSKAIEG